MTITFYSNFLNHHQLPLCQEFIKLIGEDNFHFVSCEKIHEERTKMGYEDMNVKYPFVVRAYESEGQHAKSLELAENSDVVIIGTVNPEVAAIRSKNNKLTFLYRERLFKNGTWRRFNPSTAIQLYRDYTSVRNKNFYLLGASAYAADDVCLCGFKREKCLKWGYFPELLPMVDKTFGKLRILWCGRMIWWKHPEDAVKVARYLKEKGIDFEMKMIGNGEKREVVESMIAKYDLGSQVKTFDFMAPAEIRKTMNESNVYLFTSGKQEGWGVVLNEAMNSGCVVVANRNAGSAPYLIEDGKNGFLYDGSKQMLQSAVDKMLASDMKVVSDAAYTTISGMWNPAQAANNLVEFAKTMSTLPAGPCSSTSYKQ